MLVGTAGTSHALVVPGTIRITEDLILSSALASTISILSMPGLVTDITIHLSALIMGTAHFMVTPSSETISTIHMPLVADLVLRPL